MKPVLIGLNLPSVSQKGEDKPKEICLILKILGQPTSFKKEEMKLFLSCLRGYDGVPTIYRLKLKGGIKLHIFAVGGNSESNSNIVPIA